MGIEVGMKTLPKFPYLANIVTYYHNTTGNGKSLSGNAGNFDDYLSWLKQFGFNVPIYGDHLEFPDNFPDEEITLFVLRWA